MSELIKKMSLGDFWSSVIISFSLKVVRAETCLLGPRLDAWLSTACTVPIL